MTQQERGIDLEAGWKQQLAAEFDSGYMQALRAFLRDQKRQGKVIYPPGPLMFNAFNSTPFDAVRVVILGQDPYHGPGQAHGLSFSVPEGVPPPPSLVNIFKEIHRDLGLPIPGHGCLQRWAEQGVLLLNAVLSVEQRQAASHQGRGWERFTDRAIERLNAGREGLVFLLWGSYAQKKGNLIDRQRHLVLTAPHPSPLSAHRGFIGCGHFSRVNEYLMDRGEAPIDWRLD
ncbi:uracil-DNA glycosylase [Isoalcanivorax indicus]|uniref:uracil-DNA glycosylase n=1 Tax=Isoalcanivorax indicus TaxID=2202653 RepID=UPI000DB9BEA9|nr:uracil-DNA glycosylase [Isoalcanivorax indicus]